MPELNWLAIVVAAVAVFFLSFVYYLVFDTARAPTSATTAASDAARPPAWKMGAEIVRSLIVGTVVAGLVALLGIDDIVGAVLLALALWLAFPAVLLAGSALWENVPPRIAAIHSGDWLLKLLVITGIVTLWR